MRASALSIVTLREDPADAEIASHRLLTRAGFLAKSGAGLYLYAPLLKRVIDKVARIVTEEIARPAEEDGEGGPGGLEITMPIMQEQALWERSGRWATYLASRTMLMVKDRNDQLFGLAPTAEEVVTDYAGAVLKSYKQLPCTFFQQNTKFRDEIRPRFGLMRVKEFIMMDAYSFHASKESLDRSYEAMRRAYHRAFARMGIEAFAVEADSGAIGGSGSHEFMVAADVGEDAILYCEESGYAANVERAIGRLAGAPAWQAPAQPVELLTPGTRTIDQLVDFLRTHGYPDIQAEHTVKTVLFIAKTATAEHRVAACVRGDRDVNEVKLVNVVTRWSEAAGKGAALQLRPMNPDEVRAATGAEPGFAGPGAGLKVDWCLFDKTLRGEAAVVVGANKTDTHLVGLRLGAEPAPPGTFADILRYREGDGDPTTGKPLRERRGIEVGHVFKLGTKYSAAMKCEFTGQDGKLHPFIMGCYGIGTSRVVAAAVEQHHGPDGILWPMSIAPYQCVVVPLGKPGEKAIEDAAATIYGELRARGIEAVLDDRDAKPGVKFKDWDLIGIPLRVVCGRGVAEGVVELKRPGGEAVQVPIAAAAQRVADEVRRDLEALDPGPKVGSGAGA